MLVDSKVFLNFFKYKRKFESLISLENYKFCTFNKLKILFFGVDNFSLPSLQALHNESQNNNKICDVGVVTSFKSASNPVRAFAAEKQLKLYKWPIDENACKNYDLGVVVSFGHLIPQKIISAFPLGMINVHASLLPRWRGAAPIIYALMHGDKITGVTIMKIEPKYFDIGDILAQKVVEIKPNMFLPELHYHLAHEGALLLTETIRGIPNSLKGGKKQEETLVTYAPKVDANIGEVRWNEMTAEDVYNLFRALYTYKDLRTKFQNHIVKIVELNVSRRKTNKSFPPGFIEYCKINQCLIIYCRNNSFIEVRKVKVEGKKVMTANNFNNGFLNKCPLDKRYFE